MANYVAVARSNYFRVTNVDAFLEWAASRGLSHWTCKAGEYPIQSEGTPGDVFHAIAAESGDGWPSTYYDDEFEDAVECDIADELLEYLDPRDVAILLEVGWENLRFLAGYATAVCTGYKPVYINLQDITAKATEAFPGKTISSLSY